MHAGVLREELLPADARPERPHHEAQRGVGAAAGQAAELTGEAPQALDVGAELAEAPQHTPGAGPEGAEVSGAEVSGAEVSGAEVSGAEGAAHDESEGGHAADEPAPRPTPSGDAPTAAPQGTAAVAAPEAAGGEVVAPAGAAEGPPPAAAGAPAEGPAQVAAGAAPAVEPAAPRGPAPAQAPSLSAMLDVGQPDPARADPGAAAEVQALKSTAAAELQAAASQAVEALTAGLEARREAVRFHVNAARERARADFAAARQDLGGQLATLRQEVSLAFDQAAQALPGAREQAHADLDARFDAALEAADGVIAAKSQEARALPQELQTAAVGQLQAQAGQARQAGAAKASGYPGDERGRKQAEAARAVADQLASELEGKEGEVRQAVSEAVGGLGDTFSEKAGEAKAEIESGREAAHTSLDGLLDQVAGQLDDQRQATLDRVAEAEAGLMAQLDGQEAATEAGLDAVEAQAMLQIDAGLTAGVEAIEAARADATAQISAVLDEGAALIAAGQVDGPSFAASLAEFAAGATAETVGGFAELPAAAEEALGEYEAELEAGLAAQDAQRAEGLGQIEGLVAETSAGLVGAAADAGSQITEAVGAAATDHNDQVAAGLADINTELATGCDAAMVEVHGALEGEIAQKMEGNAAALAGLGAKMDEAAADAAWSHDHPILSAVGSALSFIGGLVAGLVMVVALAVVAIAALKLIVAGLVALGLSALVATIVVAVVALVAIGYLMVTGYLAHREQGNGVFMSILLTLGDFTGINDIIRCFTEEDASPFDRGFFLGRGIATVATLIFGGRMDKMVGSRLPGWAQNPATIRSVWARGAQGAADDVADDAVRHVAGSGDDLASRVVQGADDGADDAARLARGADEVVDDVARGADEVVDDVARGADEVVDDAAHLAPGKDPMDMSLDELLRSPQGQQQLHRQANEAFAEVYGQIDNITSRFDGAESMGGLKRSNLDEFIAAVQEKVTRKNYPRVGDMGDMIRGRIEAGSGDDVARIVDELRRAFPDAVFDIKPNSPYPRVHVDLRASNGMLFELQVGTRATTQFLEGAGVSLPPRLAGKVGRGQVDFHVAKYDVLDKIVDDALRARYGLDDLSARYDQALRNTGTGQFDEAAYRSLSDELTQILARMEGEDPDALLALYTKGGHAPAPGPQAADDAIRGAAQGGDDAAQLADNAAPPRPQAEVVDDLANRLGERIKQNPLRQAYEAEVAGLQARLESLRAQGIDEEQIARAMYQARRDLSTKYKDLTPEPLRRYIYAVNEERYGDPLGASFEWLAAKYKGDFAKISEASTRPNPDVDGLLAKFRDWLYTQEPAQVEAWAQAAQAPGGQSGAVDFSIRALVGRFSQRVQGNERLREGLRAANKRNTPPISTDDEEQNQDSPESQGQGEDR